MSGTVDPTVLGSLPGLNDPAAFGFGGGAQDPYMQMLMKRRMMAQALADQEQKQAPMTHWTQVLGSIANKGVNQWKDQQAEQKVLDYAMGQRQQSSAMFRDMLASVLGKQDVPATQGAPAAQPAPAAPAQGGGFYATLRGQESGGRVDAANPRSSARGPDQIIDGTWREFMAAKPELFAGMTPEQAMAARTDPAKGAALSEQATRWYANERIAPALKAAGLPVADWTVALGHRFGPAGAIALLKADPNTPAAAVLGEDVIRANPNLGPATVGGILRPLQAQFGEGQSFAAPVAQAAAPGAPPAPAPGSPPLTTQQRLMLTAAALKAQSGDMAGATTAMAAAFPDTKWQTSEIGGNIVAYDPTNPSRRQILGAATSHTPLPPQVAAQKRELGAPYPEPPLTQERFAQNVALQPPTILNPGQSVIPRGSNAPSYTAPQKAETPPTGYRFGEPNAPGGPPTLIPIPGGDAENDRAKGLRAEYTKLTEPFRVTQDAYQKIVDASANPTGAGDMSLIFGYMKLLDPGSTVREGEYATAANAGSIPERIQGMYNKALKGERLAETVRADFVQQAKGVFAVHQRGYQQVRDQFANLAKISNVNPALVLPDFNNPSASPARAGASGADANPAPVQVQSLEDVAKLPRGTPFITPDGRQGWAQ